MTRTVAKELDSVEYLSILNEDGEFDEERAPEIGDDLLKRMARSMLLSRRLDERMLSLQRQGRVGTFALVKGQEAAQIGAAAVLGEKDWMVPSYREQGFGRWNTIRRAARRCSLTPRA